MGSAPTANLDFEEAVALVLEHAASAVRTRPWQSESVPLLESLGRVLANGVHADRDQPGFDRSTRDGFAIRAADWVAGSTLSVTGQVRAGEVYDGPGVAAHCAIEIMTGATVPRGADAVVMVEHVVRTGNFISQRELRVLKPGENIVARGSEARRDDEVVPAGTLITPAEIALAATCGLVRLDVFVRPSVAIIATGDELVEIDREPGAHQIRNSNSYGIAAMVANAGGSPQRLPIAPDRQAQIAERITQARGADLMVLSGGVSMGEYDLVEEALVSEGAEFFFTGVRMQPGRPVVFGRLRGREEQAECYFFGLPGNPVSTQVTFHTFTEIFLRTLAGEKGPGPRYAQATLREAIGAKPNLTRLLPARREGIFVTLTPWQGSGDLAANARANCYAELLPDHAYAAGDVIRILLR